MTCEPFGNAEQLENAVIMQIIPLVTDDGTLHITRDKAAKLWVSMANRNLQPQNDWEAHLPDIETLHETLERQQRGE